MNADPVKYEVDKESGAIFVDRFMSTAMHYPTNYGYVPKTISGDGDPVDVLVITPVPLIPGVVVTCRPIGILMMEDEAGQDGKVLAVPTDKILSIYTHWQKPEDLNPLRLKTIAHFFEHYKDLEPGKWVKILGWEGPEAARKEIRTASRTTGSSTAGAPTLSARDRRLRSRFWAGLERPPLVQVVQVVVDRLRLRARGSRSTASANAGAPASGRWWFSPATGPRHLVFALRAALEALPAVGDAPLQRLVVAGLEMQAVDALRARPSSGRRRSVALRSTRSALAMGVAVALGDEEQPVLRHRRAPCAGRSRA